MCRHPEETHCDGNILASAASAAETASLLETATVMATSLMPSENVEGLVKSMRTPMASATTSTHVLESSTPVACATDQERSTVPVR